MSENYLTRKFIVQNICNTTYSRITVQFLCMQGRMHTRPAMRTYNIMIIILFILFGSVLPWKYCTWHVTQQHTLLKTLNTLRSVKESLDTQVGEPESFIDGICTPTIDERYVDGVSLTYGTNYLHHSPQSMHALYLRN